MTDHLQPPKAIDLDKKRLKAASEYPSVWKNVIDEWNNDLRGNAAWLPYSANYLLHTAGVRWTIDPFSMSTRVPGIPVPNFKQDLKKLELVVLTHNHNDHLDLNLIRAIVSLPIQWVIPADMADLVLEKTNLSRNQVVLPAAGGKIEFGGLCLTPFDSLHFHNRGGVKETGYLASFEDKTWLFPGDIRNFDPERLPAFGTIDGVFAHLWLGKACALLEEPPFLDDFCTFFTHFLPKRIVVTHLNEFGRDKTELWDETHFEKARKRLAEIAPRVKVEMAIMGSRVILD